MDTLYHYCNTNAFVSMVTRRRIWLSSLTLSNDSKEGKVLSEAFKRVISKEGVDRESAIQVEALMASFESAFDGLGFCLSGDRDLLSQWRGYAADGQGFSIGFSAKYLNALAEKNDKKKPGFQLHEVLYEPLAQEAAVMAAFNEIKKEVMSGSLKPPYPPTLLTGYGDPAVHEKYEQMKKDHFVVQQTLLYKLLASLPNFFALKRLAFKEEQEWRLISFLVKGVPDECMFRASGNRLVPYREFELTSLEVPAISEVVIGPKNETPEFVVTKLLAQSGFPEVMVTRSAATYR